MATTGYEVPNGQGGYVDIGVNLVEKSYLMDRYPELVNTFRQSGLWLWGRNKYSALGDNTAVNQSSPVQTVPGGNNWKTFHVASDATGGIKTDGTLWLWGYNAYGIVGNNSTLAWPKGISTPVQTVAGGTNWKQISGADHIVAIKTDGTLWSWGRNSYGQIGNNSTANRSSPVQTISAGTNWKYVCGGYGNTAAIKTDGTLWVWGRNQYGQLGNNTTTNRSSPVQTISATTNWRQVTIGQAHMVAIKTDGTLWTWGYNSNGQIGDNTNTTRCSPVQTSVGGTNWKKAGSQSYYSSAAIKTDGTLWTWGVSNYGQLGNGTISWALTPVQTTAGGTNWKDVGGGAYHMMGLKTDGTLWMWGYNLDGQIGNNSTSNVFTPVQTVAGGSNWYAISSGGYSVSAALRDTSYDLL